MDGTLGIDLYPFVAWIGVGTIGRRLLEMNSRFVIIIGGLVA
jgi:hypothetical protein